jgi:hypothetical protein
MSGSENYVMLRGGLTLPLVALRLVWELEGRGMWLRDDGEHLLVGPPEKLTDDDGVRIRRWRDHLRAIVAYVDEERYQ